MPGFTNPKIKEDHPTRTDALAYSPAGGIAAVIQLTGRCLDNLEKVHPEIDAINKQGLINVQNQSIEVINNSSVWD